MLKFFCPHQTDSAATIRINSAAGWLVSSNEAHLYNLTECPPKKRLRRTLNTEEHVLADVTNSRSAQMLVKSMLPAKKRVEAPQFGCFQIEMETFMNSDPNLKHKVEDVLSPDEKLKSAGILKEQVVFRDSSRDAIKENSTATKTCCMDDIVCSFCQLKGDSKVAGSLMLYEDGILVERKALPDATYVHRLCAEWAPDVYFGEDDRLRNLEAELMRAQKLKCFGCGLKGAALGCFVKKCRKTYHYACARAIPESRWAEDKFLMLCSDHASTRLPGEPSFRNKS